MRRSLPERRTGLTPAGLCLAVLVVLTPAPIHGQGVGGMFFSYRPHQGERPSFDEGYRAHLQWHRARRDSLPWYGWDVIAGQRLGEFVDGTFGISFEALDRRVDPAADAAHAARSFADHARATGRWAVRARLDLSTAGPLEAREVPPPLAQVVTYTVAPEAEADFKAALATVKRDAPGAGLLPYTVYTSSVGTADGQVTVMVWRPSLASLDDPATDPARAIRRALAGSSDVRAHSELWLLRSDLTLLP